MPTHLRVLPGLLVLALGCTAPPDAQAPAPPPAPAAPASAPAAPPPAADKPPVPKDTLDKQARARYRAALADGRALHRKGDYPAAIAAFERALAVDPDDPRALAELGWAAFFARDLDLADAKTRAALARSADARGKGAALYNLGRIAEERGDKDQAIAHYKHSLQERPNDTVRDRLAALDPAAVVAYDVFTPVPLAGPFATLKAFCAGHKTIDGDTHPCDPDAPLSADVYDGPTAIARGQAPILEARILWAPGAPGLSLEAEVLIHLAIRTDQGWFVSQPVVDIYNPGAFGIHASLKATALELADLVAGGAPELRYRFTLDHYDSDMGINEYEQDIDTSLVLCGIGASGKPSCTGAILLESMSERDVLFPDQDEPGMKHDGLHSERFALTAAISPDGRIDLTSTDPVPDRARPLLGSHPLAFP